MVVREQAALMQHQNTCGRECQVVLLFLFFVSLVKRAKIPQLRPLIIQLV